MVNCSRSVAGKLAPSLHGDKMIHPGRWEKFARLMIDVESVKHQCLKITTPLGIALCVLLLAGVGNPMSVVISVAAYLIILAAVLTLSFDTPALKRVFEFEERRFKFMGAYKVDDDFNIHEALNPGDSEIYVLVKDPAHNSLYILARDDHYYVSHYVGDQPSIVTKRQAHQYAIRLDTYWIIRRTMELWEKQGKRA